MTAYGTRIQVTSLDDFERLMQHPTSLSGWFDPRRSYGEVVFPTQSAAQLAWRYLS